MNKTLIVPVFYFYILLFSFFFSPSVAADNLEEIAQKALPSTVLILATDSATNAQRQASGFFVSDDGDVITNYHVIDGASKAVIQTTDGKIYPVKKVVAKDIKSDLARVTVQIGANPVKPLKISKRLPRKGERVVVIGNPAGQRKVVSSGVISSLLQVPDFGTLLQTTVQITFGSSGSPVINTKAEVIGVIAFQLTTGTGFNFAIPSDKLLALRETEDRTLADLGGQEDKNDISEEIFQQGKRALEKKEYAMALSLFENLVVSRSDGSTAWKSWEVWFYIGRCKGELGLAAEAAAAFKEAIKIMPDLAVTYYNLGVAYSLQGQLGKAMDAYRQAIDLSPQYPEAHFNLGLACMAFKNGKCTINQYEILKRIDSTLASTFLKRIHN